MITGGGTGMEEESIIIDDDSLASAFVLYRQMVPTNIVIETLTKMETWPSPVAQVRMLFLPLDITIPTTG